MAASSTLLSRDVVLALQAFSAVVEMQPFCACRTAVAKLDCCAPPKKTLSSG
jgi:hypothetical protein